MSDSESDDVPEVAATDCTDADEPDELGPWIPPGPMVAAGTLRLSAQSAGRFESLGPPYPVTAYDTGADPGGWTSVEDADTSRLPAAFDLNLDDKTWRRAEVRVRRSSGPVVAHAVVQVQVTRHDDEEADDG